MHHMLRARLRGQSLPLVILMLALIFMVVGLGIDGGLFYGQRRLLQNTADAACLAAANQLAMGQPSTEAEAAAIAVIEQNLGPSGPGTGANAPGTLAYTAVADLYAPAVGAGAGLTRGVELSGPQVRVALASPAFTYFVRLLGQDEYTVAARARCDATAGGGGTPFAVARWRRYDGNQLVTGISTDLSIASQLSSGKGSGTPVVRDILDAAPHTITEWPGWGASSYPGSPSSGTGLYSQPSTPATLDNPGYETVIAGQGATPNIGGTSFRGPVLLDLRNVTFPNPEYYSGLTPDTSTNTYKDFVTRDILQGYQGPWIPPGTQLGFTDGVSAGQVEKPFDLRYNANDIVSTLIYNGTVYFKTDFGASLPSSSKQLQERSTAASFSGMFPENCDLSGLEKAYIFEGSDMGHGSSDLDALEYGLTVTPFETKGGSKLPHAINVDVRAFASVNGDSWNNLQARWSDGGESSGWISFRSDGTASSVPDFGLAPSGETLTVKLQQGRTDFCEYFDPNAPPPYPAPVEPEEPQTPDNIYELPIKPVSGAASIYLEATDTQTGLRRGHYIFMSLAAEKDDFFVSMPGQIAYAPVELDDKKTQSLEQPMVIQTVGGKSLKASDVSVSFAWFTGGLQPTGAPAGVSAALRQRNGGPVLDIEVAPSATPGRDYYARVAVSYKGRTHWAWYYLAIQPPMGNSKNISEYVYTLGYANFLITEISSNQIKGRAISGLLKPGDVISGRQPRLIPWNE